MTHTHDTIQNKSFMMAGAECAAFIAANLKKVKACLKGSPENKEDAISEVVCKCLGVKTGSGSLLKWAGNPFAVARTTEGWLGFVVWQCRARLGVVRAKNEYWSDPGDDNAREEAQYRHRKVCELKAYELDRQAGCHRAFPGCSYDEAVRNRAAYAVLEDLVKDRSVSRRDLEVWAACDMFRRDRAELAEEFGVTSNNLDQIVFRVRNTLKKLGPALHRRHAARLFHEAA